ncbi:MAG: transglutaminase family protein [Caulobacteraceae bacterium]
MLFEIRHITQYRYDEPVRESLIELRMQPRLTASQGLVSFELDIEPHAQVLSYADNWGNAVHHFDVPHPHERLDILARSVVETSPHALLPAELTMDEWSALKSDRVRGECWDFLAMGGFIAETDALRAFVGGRGLDWLRRRDPLTAVRSLNGALYEAFDYEAGVTDPDSPIDHALIEGRGVCQDFAHVMIAICRLWGVPARYVSGHLYTDQETHDRSTPGATHAWVEAFLPTLGWIGADPTNDLVACDRHLAVAIGRDYADVPPSRGVFKGEAEGRLSVGVSVRKTADSSSELPRMGAPALIPARRRSGGPSLLVQHHQQQQQ